VLRERQIAIKKISDILEVLTMLMLETSMAELKGMEEIFDDLRVSL